MEIFKNSGGGSGGVCVCTCVCSAVSDSVTSWTIACQAPLSMEFSRQEYWRELLFPTPGDLPDPRVELRSLVFLALAGGFFSSVPLGNVLGVVVVVGCSKSFSLQKNGN